MAARGYCKIPEVSFYPLSLVGLERESAAGGAVDKSMGMTREEHEGSTMQRSRYHWVQNSRLDWSVRLRHLTFDAKEMHYASSALISTWFHGDKALHVICRLW